MAPSLLITLAMFAASAIAAPQFQPPLPGTGTPRKGLSTCDISSTLVVPSTQTALVPPTSPASFVLLGVGFQNYTCSSAGTYTYVLLTLRAEYSGLSLPFQDLSVRLQTCMTCLACQSCLPSSTISKMSPMVLGNWHPQT
jgi:hypothetical protein